METIQPDIPWQANQGIEALPEARLIIAIIGQAFNDANGRIACSKRNEARQWFYSDEFNHYCDLINVEPSIIQRQVSRKWI